MWTCVDICWMCILYEYDIFFYKFLLHEHPSCSLQCIFFYVDITIWEGFGSDYAWILKRGHSVCSLHYNEHGIKCEMAWYPKFRQICFGCIFVFKLLKLPIRSITISKRSYPTNVNLWLFGSSNLSDNENKFIFYMVQKFIFESKRF